MPSSSDLGATKTASTKTKSNSININTSFMNMYRLVMVGLTHEKHSRHRQISIIIPVLVKAYIYYSIVGYEISSLNL